jgi:pterin-4a-carbinolamine dehydratase
MCWATGVDSSKPNMKVTWYGKAMPYKHIFRCQLLGVCYRSVTATQFALPQNDRSPANWVLIRGPKIKREFVIKQFPGVYFFISSYSSHGATALRGPGSHYRGFTITLRHTTFGRTPLNEWSARRRDLYLTKTYTFTRDRHPCPRQESNP